MPQPLARAVSALALGLVLFATAASSLALDWQSAPGQTLTLFYPGAATWEALLSGETHSGAAAIRQRKSCASCHQGQEKSLGAAMAADSDSPLHQPHEGMTTWQTTVQVARDQERLYFRVDTGDVEAGSVSLLLDDGAFESSALTGCWATCHQDTRGMPAAGAMDLSKYLARSRTRNTRTGGGENFRPAAELEQLVEEGQFLELLGATFSDQMASPLHGYVLERRHSLEETGAEAEWRDGYLVISRPLAAGSSRQKALVPGKVYSAAVALHPANTEGGDHLVSFPLLFKVGTDAIRIVGDD